MRRINRNIRDTHNPFEIPEELFRQLYRLDVNTARDIFDQLLPFLNARQRDTRILAVHQFFLTINFLAHGSYQKPVALSGNNICSQPIVSRALHKVVNVIINNLGNQYIRYPQTFKEIITIKEQFFIKHGIPGIVGCVDCTHIKIVPPSSKQLGYPSNVFMNRKNFYSINCQMICDVNAQILAADARYPGSIHDAAIWTMSNIRTFLHNNFIQGDETTHLIGDSGYPLSPYLLTPIRGAEPNTPEGRFTKRHQEIRNCIERTNGILKGVWRCLNPDCVLHYHPHFAAKIFYACVILHNIMRIRRIPVDDALYIMREDDDAIIDEEVNAGVNDLQLLHRGQQIRNRIINNFFM